MNSSQTARALVLPLLLLGLTTAGDTPTTPGADTDPRARVLYLGFRTTDYDRSFDYFTGVLARTAPAFWQAARCEFVGLPDNDPEELDRIVAERLQSRPAVVVAPNGTTAESAARWAAGVPVVFASYLDPVRTGIVDQLDRRGEPVAGISLADDLDGKRLEILKDAYPLVRRVAVLADRSWIDSTGGVQRVEAAAGRLNLEVSVIEANTTDEVQARFASLGREAFDAWYFPQTYSAKLASEHIIRQMATWGTPSIFSAAEEVERGALMAYTQDAGFVWPMLAMLVARVGSGEDAGDIPIVRPHRFSLAIRTSRDTGVAPPSIAVVRRADQVYR